ncbi:type II toxin-antitoxin system RelE/ParE family toxin [Streptomyces sp. ST2-7A]|uniref:type II toxin-antitoxin system RelE/ParE family toxin n=1 Tax=Streptomyces sp. ST2-7A TaxID=2907214 RepID=UPI0027E32C3A|nr:type II toxin-antitoxin system RelE/ParE family toxin [Streptomyces sp. ST2-7A]
MRGCSPQRATEPGEPHSRHLGDGVRELRLGLDGVPIRVTYRLTPRRTAVLLTVFPKTRRRENEEVNRARHAKKVCEAGHGPAHQEFLRTIKREEV